MCIPRSSLTQDPSFSRFDLILARSYTPYTPPGPTGHTTPPVGRPESERLKRAAAAGPAPRRLSKGEEPSLRRVVVSSK